MSRSSSSSPARLVTLLTDFGTLDGYVGAMKGVILSHCPSAAIHDVTHDVPAGDVRRGAFALADSALYYPPCTIHVAVVDPGVGTDRRPLLVEAGGSYFVGPDNGLLSLAVEAMRLGGEAEAAASARVLDRRELLRASLSATFHGRDVFAPIAGRLAAGAMPEELGGLVESMHVLELPIPVVGDTAATVVGEVLYADRFGNLITNITPADYAGASADVIVEIAGVEVGPVRTTYGDVPGGELVALVGSAGRLEIAVRNGSAALRLGAGAALGARVRLRGDREAAGGVSGSKGRHR